MPYINVSTSAKVVDKKKLLEEIISGKSVWSGIALEAIK